MKVDIVIGAAYGDEGKGRTVNDLATPESLVVRFNGGSQAGHTVIQDGKRHVFSHFGSATLKGCPTFLSKHFVCHPIEFLKEWNQLGELGRIPEVTIDPRCQVTTVFDVIINLMAEKARGDERHGSVGAGFGETIERDEKGFGLHLGYMDSASDSTLRSDFENIRDVWMPKRCEALGFDYKEVGKEFMETLTSPETITRFIEEFRAFAEKVNIPDLGWCPVKDKAAKHIIFEGAQGLMLDMDYGDFPHVTRSHCGLHNIRDFDIKCSTIQVHYVTRAYTTRHGAGPLERELPEKPYEGIEDKTNIWNDSQEGLRFSYLNLDMLQSVIQRDMYHGTWQMHYNGVMTCLDQLPEEVSYIKDGKVVKTTKEGLFEAFAGLTKMVSGVNCMMFKKTSGKFSAESQPMELVK